MPRFLLLRSLYARLILLTLGTVFLVQAATVASVTYYRKRLTEDVTVDVVATTIRTVRAALAEVPPDRRADFVREASRNEWRLWSRATETPRPPRSERAERNDRSEPPQPLPRDIRQDLRQFIETLNLKLDDGTRVGLSRGRIPRLYISLIPDPGVDPSDNANLEWLVIPLDRLTPPVATPLIVIWLAGMGILLLVAAAFAWHITRPITRLVKATDQLAQGQPQRVEPSGPTETRILGERFNAMLDALAESDAVRRTLLAGLPHDLKGPLSRMWLRTEMTNDPVYRDGMRNDIQDMQRMIDQFIGFVRGTDPATYHFAPLNLRDWVTEQVEAWETAGSEVRLTDKPAEATVVLADRLAMARLLDNLVTNAFNHGAPPVEVSLKVHGKEAILTIADHGPGISPERRAEALRPFSRLDTARTRTGSVGLGLAVSNAIVQAHHGRFSLGAAPWGGLSIEIALPLAGQDLNSGGAGGLDKPNMPQ